MPPRALLIKLLRFLIESVLNFLMAASDLISAARDVFNLLVLWVLCPREEQKNISLYAFREKFMPRKTTSLCLLLTLHDMVASSRP